MAYRFSDTLKWSDSWFVELQPMEKLLFLYLCDNCDIGGFFELSIRKISFDLGSDSQTIKAAIKGLQRGLILSDDESCVLVKNFIKHQKNLPLNHANKAHKGIISRFNMYSIKFTGLDLDPIEGYKKEAPSKPLQRGTGIGIGNDIDNGNYDTSNINGDSDFFEGEQLDDEPIVLMGDYDQKKEDLINSICIDNGFDQGERFANNRSTVYQFVTTQLKSIDDINHFIEQYKNYKLYKKNSEEKEHNFTGYFGTPAMQFKNANWNIENWGLKLDKLKSNNNQQTKTDKLNDVFGQVAQDLQNGYTTL